MNDWKILTLIGEDQVGIVAAVTKTLKDNGFNLGETSMIRLAGNFTIMMMAQCTAKKVCKDEELRAKLQHVIDEFELTLHIEPLLYHHREHIVPEINIAVHGADRTGIVADVTDVLKDLNFNILDLYSDMGGKEDTFYILNIEGNCKSGVAEIQNKISKKLDKNIKVVVSRIQTMVG